MLTILTIILHCYPNHIVHKIRYGVISISISNFSSMKYQEVAKKYLHLEVTAITGTLHCTEIK